MTMLFLGTRVLVGKGNSPLVQKTCPQTPENSNSAQEQPSVLPQTPQLADSWATVYTEKPVLLKGKKSHNPSQRGLWSQMRRLWILVSLQQTSSKYQSPQRLCFPHCERGITSPTPGGLGRGGLGPHVPSARPGVKHITGPTAFSSDSSQAIVPIFQMVKLRLREL